MPLNRFTDRLSVSGTRKTADGYLVAEAFAVRTGIQDYLGSELGLKQEKIRVYRPEDEVKAPRSLRTFSHAPITVGHPNVFVDAHNWSQLAVGEVSTEAEWVDGKIRLPLIIKDQAAIDVIQQGTRELSAGYLALLEMKPGKTPEGEEYDAVMRDITFNHLAIVEKGRAGPECRIGDADYWGFAPITVSDHTETKMSDALMTVVLGDKAVNVAAASAPIIEDYKKTQAKSVSDAEAEKAKLVQDHDTAIKAKDTEIGELKAKVKKLEDDALTPEKMQKIIADRVELIQLATKIDDSLDFVKLTDLEVKKACVSKKMGADAVKDASEAEINGMFKVLASTVDQNTADPVLNHVADRSTNNGKPAEGRAAYIKGLQDAYKPKEN